jgi:large subunit ribosomal protein L40
VLPSAEAYETIERAWLLFQREKRVAKTRALEAKYKAMEEACDELDRMTSRVEEGGEGAAPRFLYDRAMARPSQFPVESAKGKKAGAESRWLEARIEGMVPREAWVPTETRGKGWNYDWKRPGSQ